VNKGWEAIFIPVEARGKLLAAIPTSKRLRNVFEFKGLSLCGELHGLSYSEIRSYRNCGNKTVTELRALVRSLGGSHQSLTTPGDSSLAGGRWAIKGVFVVPEQFRNLKVAELPVSVRLENALLKKGARDLGGVHGILIEDLRALKNCGRKTVSELVHLIERAASGEFSAEAEIAWNPANMIRTLDSRVANTTSRNDEIFLTRMGANSDALLTLEEVGARFHLTHERVRQVAKLYIERIRKEGGQRLKNYVDHVERICFEKACPLSTALLGHWLQGSSPAARFNLSFYVRLLGELRPSIPVWPAARNASCRTKKNRYAIERAFAATVCECFEAVPLPKAFAKVRAKASLRRVDLAEFLYTLQISRRFKTEFPRPDAPVVRLARRRSAWEVGKAVLQMSEAPLTPEEILRRAPAIVPGEPISWNPRSLGGALHNREGIYLLGPRSYGLRQHFSMPQAGWQQARSDFRGLLRREKRPISTAEVVRARRFSWAAQTNTYELACILREDQRLIDLGRFLFALSVWGIEELRRIGS
jgi:hypothetical protein